MSSDTQTAIPVKVITFTAVMTAANIALSSFGIPVPGGHLYFCAPVICIAGLLLPPFPAFVVGGIGSFLGDFFFYPAPMFVSLVTQGLRAVMVSLISHKKDEEPRFARSVAAVIIGGMWAIIGYSLGRAFIYSTIEYAIIKLPFEFLTAAFAAVVSLLVVFKMRIGKLYHKYIG